MAWRARERGGTRLRDEGVCLGEFWQQVRTKLRFQNRYVQLKTQDYKNMKVEDLPSLIRACCHIWQRKAVPQGAVEPEGELCSAPRSNQPHVRFRKVVKGPMKMYRDKTAYCLYDWTIVFSASDHESTIR